MEVFPKLYKKTSTGSIQEWEVYVDDTCVSPVIVTKFGQLGGKIQTSTEVITKGKNIGRSNETSPMQQAYFQAKSNWEKQLKKGYVQSVEDAYDEKTDAIITGGIVPMLAHKFSEQGHKIKYPALAQPKLDGHRCIGQGELDGTYSLWSRTRKPILALPHINKALQNAGIYLNYLDGELYNHTYHNNFEELSSFIRQEEVKEGHEIVQYHVYDFPDDIKTNYERFTILESFRPLFEGTPVHIVETIVVNDEDELMTAFEHFLDEGYEGCMVRNMDGKYVYKRSYDLQKVKEFDDDEFKIIGVKVSTKGVMAGKGIFICQVQDQEDKTFECKLKGSLDELVKYAEDPNLAIGRLLTVQFQGYTKYGIPRFPVGLRFKDEI